MSGRSRPGGGASSRSSRPDLLVLGCGAAGYYCALAAARCGLKTIVVESAEPGGTAFRWGCLPSKRALDAVKAREAASGEGGPLRGLLARTARWLPGIERRIEGELSARGIELLRGEGAFLDRETFRLGGRELHPRWVAVATGTRPGGLAGAPLDGRRVVSHQQVFAGGAAPRRLVIAGADVEGCEFAALFSALGSRVTLVDGLEELLPGRDRDLVAPVEERLSSRGVELRLGAGVAGVERRPRGLAVELADGGVLEAEQLLVTGQRRANLPAGLERTGAEVGPAGILTAADLSTAAAGLYAIGDVNGRLGMAHAAIQQGTLLARHLGRGFPLILRYDRYPGAIYTLPEIAGAGSQERELQAEGVPYRCGRVRLQDTWRGLTRGVERGFLKLLAGEGGRVLGLWASGAEAAEAAALFGLLLERELTVEELLGSLVIHPTLAEALREAALAAASG